MPFENIVGGLIPKIISLNIPPPKAVIQPTKTTPKTSSPAPQAISAPDMEKAIVPIISNSFMNSSIFYISPFKLRILKRKSHF